MAVTRITVNRCLADCRYCDDLSIAQDFDTCVSLVLLAYPCVSCVGFHKGNTWGSHNPLHVF